MYYKALKGLKALKALKWHYKVLWSPRPSFWPFLVNSVNPAHLLVREGPYKALSGLIRLCYDHTCYAEACQGPRPELHLIL